MKAMVLTGIKQMEMREWPDPAIKNDHDVKIKLKRVGVCGSDIHYYRTGKIGSQVVEFPFPVGHESGGVVVEVGRSVTKVKPGDRIAIEPAISCGECDQCLAGRPNTCRHTKFLGCPGQIEGCLTDFVVMPEENSFPIPDTMSFDEAAISEPLAIGLYAVKQSGLTAKDKIGILGFGPIGMSVMLPARAFGARNFYVTDKIDERLKIAVKLVAAWTGNPEKENVADLINKKEPLQLDVVFECCGEQDAINDALKIVKPGGKIMLIGIPEQQRLSFDMDFMRRKEITVINVRRQRFCVQEALDLMSSGRIDISPMATHRFNFRDTKKAFDLVDAYHDGVMKAMIEF
ncbi:MAG: alcohol dehydrogenase catalytic domain-containing protein [Cyclobacteriaceae bacterium]|nr:alcohol dehydrogenase catalytic domain-containing protein [Cyclobacteriaceae bacterium]